MLTRLIVILIGLFFGCSIKNVDSLEYKSSSFAKEWVRVSIISRSSKGTDVYTVHADGWVRFTRSRGNQPQISKQSTITRTTFEEVSKLVKTVRENNFIEVKGGGILIRITDSEVSNREQVVTLNSLNDLYGLERLIFLLNKELELAI